MKKRIVNKVIAAVVAASFIIASSVYAAETDNTALIPLRPISRMLIRKNPM